MNPKEFLNIVIEKFPLIKIDFERVRDFADKISSVGITFGTGSSGPWAEEWLCLEESGRMHYKMPYKRFMTTTDITDEDHLRRIVDNIFNSGVSVDKVYLTITPEQHKEEDIGDKMLQKMSEEVGREECQRLVEELSSGEKK
jgi:hypothetical protein